MKQNAIRSDICSDLCSDPMQVPDQAQPRITQIGSWLERRLAHERLSRKRKGQRGFTLVEVIIVLAIVGVALAGVLVLQGQAEERNRITQVITALNAMAGTTRAVFAPANTFTAVTATNLINAGVVVPPFTVAGTAVNDPWGGGMTVGGSPSFFGFSVTAPNQSTCMAIVSALAPSAVRVTVGGVNFTAGPGLDAFLTGTHVAKANAAAPFNAGNAAIGCNLAPVAIGFAFR